MHQIRHRPSVAGAIVLIGAVTLTLVTNWDPIANGHPSYLVLYFGSLVLGGWLAWSGWTAAVEEARPVRSTLATVGLLVLAGIAVWLSPFGAEEVALEAMSGTAGVTLTETATRVVFDPDGEEPLSALLFRPGARVDARSYARTLLPIAEVGHRVVILKEPLGIAFLSLGALDSAVEDNPDIDTWVVGGHSLGGVAASADAQSESTDGLLLWASYPASDISDVDDLEVASVYGTNDGLSTPERVEASAEDLPDSTTFSRIEGAIHAHFGDYGVQPGDGEPAVDRASAQSEIAASSVQLLDRLVSP